MEDKIQVKTILKEDWDSINALSVSMSQSGYIECSEKCLYDAKTNAYDMEWNFYGVYLDGVLIGFAMHGRQYFKYSLYSQVWLDRFMIDQRYQKKGYGKVALRMILKKMIKEYRCLIIYLSVVDENINAIAMYRKLGFIKTWMKDENNERIMIKIK